MTIPTARRDYLTQRGDWEHRRRVWHRYLGSVQRGQSLSDVEGTTWTLLTPDDTGDVFTYRVWQSEHGQGLLEPDLAGVLAWQDVHARRPLLRALQHAAQGLRWTILGLWRTPAVRVALLMLGAAIVAGGVVLAGMSVAP